MSTPPTLAIPATDESSTTNMVDNSLIGLYNQTPTIEDTHGHHPALSLTVNGTDLAKRLDPSITKAIRSGSSSASMRPSVAAMRATLRMATPKQIGGPKLPNDDGVHVVVEKESDEESFNSSDGEISEPKPRSGTTGNSSKSKSKSYEETHDKVAPPAHLSKPTTAATTTTTTTTVTGVAPLHPAPNVSPAAFEAMSVEDKKENSYVYYEEVKPHKIKSVAASNRWSIIAENKKHLDNEYVDPIHNVLDTPRLYRKTEYHASDFIPPVDENQLLNSYRRIRDAVLIERDNKRITKLEMAEFYRKVNNCLNLGKDRMLTLQTMRSKQDEILVKWKDIEKKLIKKKNEVQADIGELVQGKFWNILSWFTATSL